jgi:tripartite-type tricarboxylate transporter receptor subunit TctC
MKLTTVLGIGAAALLAFTVGAGAQSYPSQNVKIIVPFQGGSVTDTLARVLAEKLAPIWKQNVIVENRPGLAGTTSVAKSPADGYTLLMVSGTQTVNETLYAKKPYHLMQDLVPVAPLIDTDLVLVVHPSVPAKNLQELLALARAKPGSLNYGSSGPGSNYHMAGELLKNLTGIDIVHVPYKGSTGARNDILSGQIQMLFDSVPTMAPMIKAGLVRAIGTSGLKRSPILPDVPTLDEAGAKGFQATLWTGFMAPAGTPKDIVEKLNRAISAAVSEPELRKKWEEQGANPLVMTQPEYAAFMRAQVEKWAKVIAANHIELIN